MATAAPTCVTALHEATQLWPDRNRASDGILPSAAHHAQNPNSDHEEGNAFDLTNDPAHGCNTYRLAILLAASRDERVSYIISNRSIWNPSISPDWRPYHGSDPHTGHMHTSIKPQFRDDKRPWWGPLLKGETVMPNAKCVAFLPTPSGLGYRLIGADGGVFNYGDANDLGSIPGQQIHLNTPVTAAASTPSGNGYWLVSEDYGVFSFGDASFYGHP